MKAFSVLVAAVSLLGVSCERHEFDGPNGTKQLHEHHGSGGHGHGEAGHGDHAEEAGHGGHEEKKDAH